MKNQDLAPLESVPDYSDRTHSCRGFGMIVSLIVPLIAPHISEVKLRVHHIVDAVQVTRHPPLSFSRSASSTDTSSERPSLPPLNQYPRSSRLLELSRVHDHHFLARRSPWGPHRLYLPHHVHALRDPPEDRVPAIQPVARNKEKVPRGEGGVYAILRAGKGSKRGGRRGEPPDTYQGVSTVVMKNWEPFVLGPALAMDRSPTPLCLSVKFSSGTVV